MAETATGVLTEPIDRMRTMLSKSETFQEWVDVDPGDIGTPTGEAEALMHAHRFGLNEDPENDTKAARQALRPFAAVDYGREYRAENRLGVNTVPTQAGSVVVYFEKLANDQNPIKDQFIAFGNELSDIMGDLWSLAYSEGALSLRWCEMLKEPTQMEEKLKDGLEFFDCIVQFGWGGAGA